MKFFLKQSAERTDPTKASETNGMPSCCIKKSMRAAGRFEKNLRRRGLFGGGDDLVDDGELVGRG